MTTEKQLYSIASDTGYRNSSMTTKHDKGNSNRYTWDPLNKLSQMTSAYRRISHYDHALQGPVRLRDREISSDMRNTIRIQIGSRLQ